MSESDQSGAGRREVAYRMFAAEYDDADFSYSESDQDRAPNYVITPTGARVNRLFVVGVLTEVESVSDDVLRGRVVDPTGAFVLYAGQYQPDEQAFLEGAETPTFVAVTGKARTFQPEDSQQVFTSIRPESINEVSADTRDRWTVQTAEQTLDRIRHTATALTLGESGDALRETLEARGIDAGLAAGIPLALDHYGTTATYLDALREMALNAARVVAGERDEVGELTANPDADGAVTAMDLVETLPDESLVDEAGDTGGSTGETSAVAGSESTAQPGTEPSSTESETTTGQAETDSAETAVETDHSEETAAERDETATADDSETATTADETATIEEPTTADETTTDTSMDDVEDELGDFDPGEYDLDSDEREQIEEEYGTEFQTGTEVEEPGEADIETPDPESETAEQAPDAGAGDTEPETETADSEPEDGADEPDPEMTTEPETDADTSEGTTPESGEDDEPQDGDADGAKPDDVQAALVELMETLDEGDGAPRETLKTEMQNRYGVGEDETEEAIQQALMDGQCYEPDDTTLKSI